MDPVALALANALVGNPTDEAALEITVIGPRSSSRWTRWSRYAGPTSLPPFRATGRCSRARDALPRGPRDARRAPTSRSRADSPSNRCSAAAAPTCRGSSAATRAGRSSTAMLGLRDPDGPAILFAEEHRDGSARWSAPPLTLPDREPILVHVIEGQHFASFDANSQRVFDTVWRVAPDSNRMGFRLSGRRSGGRRPMRYYPGRPASARCRCRRAACRSRSWPTTRLPEATRASPRSPRRTWRGSRSSPRRQGALREVHPRDGGRAQRDARTRLESALRGTPGNGGNETYRPQLRHG